MKDVRIVKGYWHERKVLTEHSANMKATLDLISQSQRKGDTAQMMRLFQTLERQMDFDEQGLSYIGLRHWLRIITKVRKRLKKIEDYYETRENIYE